MNSQLNIMNNKLTLHEAITKRFEKTPNGEMFSKDLKTIFCTLIICLNLTATKTSKITELLSRHFPYSFSVNEAIEKMSNLSLSIETKATSTTMSYQMKPELANSLLVKFMDAKLLHTPADRTRSEPKNDVLLQPTPKGVAVIYNFCKKSGFKKSELPEILSSDFNSMILFEFERSSTTDLILFSEYFINLLFIKFLGDEPNVWGPKNPHDELPPLSIFMDNFENKEFDFSLQQSFDFISDISTNNNAKQQHHENKLLKFNKKPKAKEPPFAHHFFTNPESDSHVQYYVSNKGVRLYKDYKFGDKPIKIDYCFNAKAAWQWLMDCTDIMYPKEASRILEMFYKYGLISPIILAPSTSKSSSKIMPIKSSFYTLSKNGFEISHWNKKVLNIRVANGSEIINDTSCLILSSQIVSNVSDDDFSSEENEEDGVKELTLKQTLTDPGIRYLFRTHLEKQYCAENLDVYLNIRTFKKKLYMLKTFMESHKASGEPDDETVRINCKEIVVRFINECLSLAYNIYSSYISVGATYQLNIEHGLREEITSIMTHPKSPVRASFFSSDAASELPAWGGSLQGNACDALQGKPSRRTDSNRKKLSIDILASRIEFVESPTIPKTPTAEELSQSLFILKKLSPLLDKVSRNIYRLMENDSFPKFLSSKTYLELTGRV